MDENNNNFTPDQKDEDRDRVIRPFNTTGETPERRIEEESSVKNFYSMDRNGNIRSDKSGAAAVTGNTRTFIILGWISAGLTAFISAFFAIAGITFGILANRQVKGSGNAVIITNIVLAIVNFIFGLFLMSALRRMMVGI